MSLNEDKNDAKRNAQRYGFGKEGLNCLRRSISGNIDVIGWMAEQKIADPASCIVGDKTRFYKRINNKTSLRMFFHIFAYFLATYFLLKKYIHTMKKWIDFYLD